MSLRVSRVRPLVSKLEFFMLCLRLGTGEDIVSLIGDDIHPPLREYDAVVRIVEDSSAQLVKGGLSGLLESMGGRC